MKTTKFLSLAALALIFAACSSNDDEILNGQQPAEQPGEKMITVTATVSADDNNSVTRTTLTEGTNSSSETIVKSAWKVGDQIAVLYNFSSTDYKSIATVRSVDGTTGAATITFDIPATTPNNTSCQMVYPASAVTGNSFDPSDLTTVLATGLKTQNGGTLATCPEVRVTPYANSLLNDGTTASLSTSIQLSARSSIYKFTICKNRTSLDPITVSELKVIIDGNTYTITPTTPSNVIYAALPEVSATTDVRFEVTDNASTPNKYTHTKYAANMLLAKKYVESTLKMNWLFNGHECVEMGDGLKWATCNIGADKPHDNGSHFAWGEKSTKTNYSWSTYDTNLGTSESNMTKYNSTDGKTTLEAADDVATQVWGSGWRIPTKTECDALLDNTNFTKHWITNYNGVSVKGVRIVSNISGYEGNEIFLPVAVGYYDGTNHVTTYSTGTSNRLQSYYWTSTRDNSEAKYAKTLRCYEIYSSGSTSNPGLSSGENFSRCKGLAVRAVHD